MAAKQVKAVSRKYKLPDARHNSYQPRQAVRAGSKLILEIMFKHDEKGNGFTIIEVIIALVIVGTSMVMFVRLLGNSSMLRAKVNDYDERLDVAILKTEQTFLGTIKDFSAQDNGKNVLKGKIADRDINWRIEGENDDSFSEHERGVYLYTVTVDGIDISSVGLR